MQMEQEKEKEKEQEKEERKDEGVRIESAGMVNGDMGDGSTDQSDQHSAPHTDSETKAENEEGSTDQKVCTLIWLTFHVFCSPPKDPCVDVLCVSYLERDQTSAFIPVLGFELI